VVKNKMIKKMQSLWLRGGVFALLAILSVIPAQAQTTTVLDAIEGAVTGAAGDSRALVIAIAAVVLGVTIGVALLVFGKGLINKFCK